MDSHSTADRKLTAIKLLHTLIWSFFVACIAAIPVAAELGHFVLGAAFAGMVLLECAVLAINRGRCPLTDLAARYTDKRTDNSDIYLPVWLARRNKEIFGPLFAIGVVYLLARCFIASW